MTAGGAKTAPNATHIMVTPRQLCAEMAATFDAASRPETESKEGVPLMFGDFSCLGEVVRVGSCEASFFLLAQHEPVSGAWSDESCLSQELPGLST